VGRFPRILPDLWFNYVQNTEPNPPDGLEEGEMWYEPDSNTSYVYDGASWIEMTVTAHSQLTGISTDDHHNPVTASNPLNVAAGQGLSLSLGTPLHVDANGNLDIPDGALGEPLLAFDTATQSELDSHAGNASAHHSRPTSTDSYSNTFTFDRVDNGNTFYPESTYSLQIDGGGYCSQIDAYHSGGGSYVVDRIELQFRGDDSRTINIGYDLSNGNFNQSYQINDRLVESATMYSTTSASSGSTTYDRSLTLHEYRTYPHSHGV